MSEMTDKAQEHLSELADSAKSAAHSTASAHVEKTAETVADKATSAARSAEAAAAEFDPASIQAEALRRVADRVELLAAKVRASDLDSIVTTTTEYARRNPLLFLGAAAVAGFAATRFLRASEPQAVHNFEDPWGTADIGMARGDVESDHG